MFDYKKAVAGAVSGAVAAILVDVDAWKNSVGPYDWKVALRRVAIGAITGVFAAFGITGATA